jgi:hypothetical protein
VTAALKPKFFRGRRQPPQHSGAKALELLALPAPIFINHFVTMLQATLTTGGFTCRAAFA